MPEKEASTMSNIKVESLDCGATLIVEPIESVRSAAIVWKNLVGAAHDPSEALGTGAMLEELLLRGAGELDSRAQADAFDLLGVSRGCSVGTLSTVVSASMVADRLADVLPLLADVVLRPRFDASSIEPTRALAKADLDSLADEPADRASLGARALHWSGALARSGYGTHKGLDAVTQSSVREHWHTHAVPDGAIISVAGHVDPDAIASQLNELLKNWSGSRRAIDASGAPTRGYGHITDDSEQVQVVVVHDAPLETDADAWAYRMATQVLAGGMASRLFTEVREKRGLCYSVSSGYKTDAIRGWRTSYVGTTPARAQESLDVLADELQRLTTAAGAVTQVEFDRARAGLRSRVVFSGESTAARASALASDMNKLGRPRSLAELTAQIDSLTLDQVNATMARLDPGRATVQTLGPQPLEVPAWLKP